MGRGVETALLAFLADHARHQGVQSLRGWYLPTAKNSPVRDCYQRHGFSLVERRADGATLWELDLSQRIVVAPGWLAVRTPPTLAA
jgi:predicted enzyme involved in methoxymalonyl-ACP biosynthesis